MLERLDRDGVAVLRMQHGKVNALDTELLAALAAALDDVERSGAAALVLTGSGRSFSAGVDLFRVVDGGAAYVQAFLPAMSATLRALFFFPRPVVAALNGHAIAGGFILACACDRRLMAEGPGRAGVPELRVGVPFPFLALEILRAATPGALLDDLAYTGQTFAPEEALRLGLVQGLAPEAELLGRACEAAAALAVIPAASFRMTKEQLREPVRARCRRLEAEFDARVRAFWCSEAARAAIGAYLQRTLGRSR